MAEDGLTYSDSGVDIETAQRALGSVTEAIRATHGPEVVGGVGGFGGLFRFESPEGSRPLLVSSI
ncbi:MAG: hypothetical protein MH204_04335, partial [Fimbriimonadaceae bacterium]|nr:hypothetical protein [Fimbriimonadaceae bacterium]